MKSDSQGVLMVMMDVVALMPRYMMDDMSTCSLDASWGYLHMKRVGVHSFGGASPAGPNNEVVGECCSLDASWGYHQMERVGVDSYGGASLMVGLQELPSQDMGA